MKIKRIIFIIVIALLVVGLMPAADVSAQPEKVPTKVGFDIIFTMKLDNPCGFRDNTRCTFNMDAIRGIYAYGGDIKSVKDGAKRGTVIFPSSNIPENRAHVEVIPDNNGEAVVCLKWTSNKKNGLNRHINGSSCYSWDNSEQTWKHWNDGQPGKTYLSEKTSFVHSHKCYKVRVEWQGTNFFAEYED